MHPRARVLLNRKRERVGGLQRVTYPNALSYVAAAFTSLPCSLIRKLRSQSELYLSVAIISPVYVRWRVCRLCCSRVPLSFALAFFLRSASFLFSRLRQQRVNCNTKRRGASIAVFTLSFLLRFAPLFTLLVSHSSAHRHATGTHFAVAPFALASRLFYYNCPSALRGGRKRRDTPRAQERCADWRQNDTAQRKGQP